MLLRFSFLAYKEKNTSFVENGDTVTTEVLVEKALLPKGTNYVKVLARGHLNKRLTVEANEYSSDAIKMIILTGGKVIKIK